MSEELRMLGPSWANRITQPGDRMIVPPLRQGARVLNIVLSPSGATINYDRAVSGGDASGFNVEINGAKEPILSAVNGTALQIVVTWASVSVSGDVIGILYQSPPGAWENANGTQLRGYKVKGVQP